jgi:hypothetical protein
VYNCLEKREKATYSVNVRPVNSNQQDCMMAVDPKMHSWLHVCSLALAGVVIISSAFHFWPFDESKTWQMLYPSNSVLLIWILILMVHFVAKRNHWTFCSLLPHLSVLAYLTINILSVAFAQDSGRAINFTFKLVLMFIGGHLLFSSAVSSVNSFRIVYGLMTVTLIISVISSLLARIGLISRNFGFFDNPYKHGTYIGTLTPLCAAYLFMSPRYHKRLLAIILAVGALISIASLGGVIAILVGMAAFAVMIRAWFIRICIIAFLACGIGLIILLNSSPASEFIHDDVKLVEKDGINLKQRYIEWQAELNLLEERPVTGTAAGCINEYRSNFYYRLPKLNTLKAFDQNGWTATGAETGILGLMCFCWIVAYNFKLAYSQAMTEGRIGYSIAHRFALANFVGLIAACVANLFSSVHYNGILIVFVLVLALISRVSLLENSVKC